MCLSCVMSIFLTSRWDLVPSVPWFSGLQIWTELYTIGSPDLQLADNRSWNFQPLQTSCESTPTNTHTCVCVYIMFTVLKSIQHTYIECLLLSRQCSNLPRPHGAIYFSFVDCGGLQDNRAKQH